ncbi:DUF4391 domain-containing protein [Thiomicrospira sp. R3]|uniref:DUF4391 domain-containing protein n=1 Tax=Thiomicrospira sp. R3 TaxID=3035472 RepID=UPI00259B867C|nr:DUF4391 domain-containing protein [Thiomicrospira sp. R3]WFE69105.1 DUF4391 domain-containing protein [Thiomicrospira sp. R3]
MLLEALQLPPALHFNQKLTKKSFYDNGQLPATAQRLLQEQVETLMIQAHITPDNSNIPAYQTAQHEYLELFVIQVTLKDQPHPNTHKAGSILKPAQLKTLHEWVHKAIAYPILLEIKAGQQVQWSLAEKTVHQADSEHDKLIMNESIQTDWIDIGATTRLYARHGVGGMCLEQDFYNALRFDRQNQQNLYRLYQSLIYTFTRYQTARLTGATQLPTNQNSGAEPDIAAQRAKLKHIQQLKKDIDELANKLKTCAHFNEKVALNIKLQNHKQQLEQIKTGAVE